jgi:hypothetical protein
LAQAVAECQRQVLASQRAVIVILLALQLYKAKAAVMAMVK